MDGNLLLWGLNEIYVKSLVQWADTGGVLSSSEWTYKCQDDVLENIPLQRGEGGGISYKRNSKRKDSGMGSSRNTKGTSVTEAQWVKKKVVGLPWWYSG